MMSKNEFFEAVKDKIKDYLPPIYQDATVDLVPKVKNNDQELMGIVIRGADETVIPNIYLDAYYEAYARGDMSLETVLEAVSRDRVENAGTELEAQVKELLHYDSIKEKLQIRLCDPENNEARLNEVVSSRCGDFAAVYYVNLFENEEGVGGVAVTPPLLESWGISLERLHTDALAADLSRTPVLSSMDDLMSSMLFGEEPVNLLDRNKTDKEQAENQPGMFGAEVPMYCLTNAGKMNGASLVINEELMKSVSEVLGDDLFVLPSSVHEVLLVPASLQMELSCLQDMVIAVNETEVAPEDLLSNKVQYYDKSIGILENVQVRAARLEKEKKAERAEEPKSVLQRLSDKKEQCAEAGRNIMPGERKTPQLAI